MQQGSKEWHEFRKCGIGSSDAPIVMLASPWRTPFQLWEEKTASTIVESISNFAMERGQRLEPEARARYELQADCSMEPDCFINEKYPFIRASLDGWNAEKRRILEIKCPGIEDHLKAREGKIPEKYVWQLVHQLMCVDGKEAHYASYHDKELAVVTFERDPKLELQLLEKEVEFWDLVKKRTPPELTDRDFLEVTPRKSLPFANAAASFSILKKELARIEGEIETAKLTMIEEVKRLGVKRARFEGVRIQEVTRKGNVDYSKIPELKNIDLEAFRKKSTVYFDVRCK